MLARRAVVSCVALALLVATAGSPAPAASPAGAPSRSGVVEPVVTALCPLLQSAAEQVPPIQGVADMLCALERLQITYVTVYDPPGSSEPVGRTHVGLVGVPSPLDVGESPSPELSATLTLPPEGGVSLEVSRVAGVTGELPVSVEAVTLAPNDDGRRAAIGYDALDSNAPDRFSGQYVLQDATTSVTVNTSLAGPNLAVLGEVFTPGEGAVRTNPQKVRIGYAPVPAMATSSIDLGTEGSRVAATTDVPSVVDVRAEDRQGAHAVVLQARIDRLPGAISVDLLDDANGAKSLAYRAPAPINGFDATFRETDGEAVLQEALIGFRDVPGEIEIRQPAADGLELTASAPIGVAQAALSRGGNVRLLDAVDDPAFVYVVEDGATSSRALRALGVEHVKAGLSDGLSLQATMQSGPFRARLEDGARSIDTTVRNLPSQIDLTYAPRAGTLTYTASGPIAEMSALATDTSSLFGRATHVTLTLRQLPSTLTLGFSQIADDVAVDAFGSQVGLLELSATNGPSPTVPSSRDGLQVQDRGAAYLFFARITGLRKATASISPDPDLYLDATGQRIFEADLNARTGSEDVYLRAMLDALQPATRLRIVPNGSRSTLRYSAASPAASLHFATNGDDESDYVEAVFQPVPASFELCSSPDTACASSGAIAANAGAVRIGASEPTTINLFECAKPLTGCTPSNATESTSFENVRARVAALDANVGSGGLTGRVFFDTDDHELTGRIVRELSDPVADRLTLFMPTGFKAQNRLARWPGDPTTICTPFGCFPGPPAPVTRTGSITCPGGTAMEARLTSLVTVDVDSYLC